MKPEIQNENEILYDRLKERVSDCGPPAKANADCKVSANATLPYPQCCPVYDCAPGVQLEFPEIPLP